MYSIIKSSSFIVWVSSVCGAYPPSSSFAIVIFSLLCVHFLVMVSTPYSSDAYIAKCLKIIQSLIPNTFTSCNICDAANVSCPTC